MSPQYSEEEGILRIFIRTRPVSLLCPSVAAAPRGNGTAGLA